jgi:hypothetical protein
MRKSLAKIIVSVPFLLAALLDFWVLHWEAGFSIGITIACIAGHFAAAAVISAGIIFFIKAAFSLDDDDGKGKKR